MQGNIPIGTQTSIRNAKRRFVIWIPWANEQRDPQLCQALQCILWHNSHQSVLILAS